MRFPILCSLILLPIIGHAAYVFDMEKKALTSRINVGRSWVPITPEPFMGFSRLSLVSTKNMCLSDPVLDLFTEQTEKPEKGYYLSIKDKENAFVYFSLKEEMTKHLV